MKLAIFDLDGVLVKTDQIHTSSLRHAVKQFVSTEAATLPYLDARDGVRTIEKLHRLQREYSLSDVVVGDIGKMKTQLTRCALPFIERNEIAIEVMTKLKEDGYKLAVASNSRREFVSVILKGLGVDSLLDLVVCGDEVKTPKPDPEIFLTVMERLNIPANHTIIFEDSPSGLKAAFASGAKVVQVDPAELITMEKVKGA